MCVCVGRERSTVERKLLGILQQKLSSTYFTLEDDDCVYMLKIFLCVYKIYKRV